MIKPVYEFGNIMENEGLFCRCNKGVSRVGQKSITNWHQHIELLYCITGKSDVFVEDRMLMFQDGDVIIIDSGKIHSITALERTEYICVHVDREFCVLNGIDTDKIRFVGIVQNGTELIKSILKLKNAVDSVTQYKTAHINAALLDLVILLCEKYSVEPLMDVKECMAFKRVRNLMMYIKQNFDKKLTLDLLAAEIGINKYQLTRDFKAVTRQSLNEYINSVRCHNAKRMIVSGMSVCEAAYLCGYNNLSYFSKTYKKYFNILPSETAAESIK